MRTVFEEEEEDLAPPDPEQDRELTISSTTLLAIFFGLVLVCGLFFGLGYTLGRRAPSEASQLPADASPNVSASALPPTDGQPKPSAASQPVAAPEPTATDADTTDASGSATPGGSPQDGTIDTKTPETTASPAPQPVKQQAPAPVQAQPAATTTQTPAVASAAAPAAIMVQIAAISNPADANVLVSALHRVPGDPLIHVQVGPFSNRADAIAMRQKLLGDGYNAILK